MRGPHRLEAQRDADDQSGDESQFENEKSQMWCRELEVRASLNA